MAALGQSPVRSSVPSRKSVILTRFIILWKQGSECWKRASALDVVTEAVRLLEECPLFNAGIGSVFTRDETHELDACVMDGITLKAGAVAGVSHLRNPVLAARLVMENSPHVLLTGAGAEQFAVAHGMESVSPDLFSTPERYQQLLDARSEGLHSLTIPHRWMRKAKWVRWGRLRWIKLAILPLQRLPVA